MTSGCEDSTASTLAVLPRPVKRPSVGSSAYLAGMNARCSFVGGEGQPTSFSGARVYTKTLAGPPAANTRSILAGTSIRRPVESTIVCLSAGNDNEAIRIAAINVQVTMQIFPARAMHQSLSTTMSDVGTIAGSQ